MLGLGRPLAVSRSLVRLCALPKAPGSVVSRHQSTATAASTNDGPPITETNRAEATMSRFWDVVGIEPRGNDTLAVTLDKRALKTPSGNTLLLPRKKQLAATLVAAEWENQENVLKTHTLPMTSLTSRAIDNLAEEAARAELRTNLLEYLDTDAICFYHDYPDPLVELQAKHWDPLIEWVQSTHDVKIHTFHSILSKPQPAETKKKLDKIMSTFDSWEMAAMERATHYTKSFIIALALVQKHITVDEASSAARVEVNSQIERWGEVEDTHDVDHQDVRRQLGSVACLLSHI